MADKERANVYKFCDKCSRTYLNSIDKCSYCGGDLREFETPFDPESL
jgi:hypothetical protein